MPFCVTLMPLVVKFGCPRTNDAFMPFVMVVVLKTRMRLLSWSETNKRLFAASRAAPWGLAIPDCVRLFPVDEKFGWPRTNDAFMPFVMVVVLKTSTRLL